MDPLSISSTISSVKFQRIHCFIGWSCFLIRRGKLDQLNLIPVFCSRLPVDFGICCEPEEEFFFPEKMKNTSD